MLKERQTPKFYYGNPIFLMCDADEKQGLPHRGFNYSNACK